MHAPNMGEHSRLIWSSDAETDLISIWRRGAEQWSAEIADKHLFEIEYACERLVNEPALGKLCDDLIVGLHSIPIRPHLVFYQVINEAIQIVRVLHERMDVENLFG